MTSAAARGGGTSAAAWAAPGLGALLRHPAGEVTPDTVRIFGKDSTKKIIITKTKQKFFQLCQQGGCDRSDVLLFTAALGRDSLMLFRGEVLASPPNLLSIVSSSKDIGVWVQARSMKIIFQKKKIFFDQFT